MHISNRLNFNAEQNNTTQFTSTSNILFVCNLLSTSMRHFAEARILLTHASRASLINLLRVLGARCARTGAAHAHCPASPVNIIVNRNDACENFLYQTIRCNSDMADSEFEEFRRVFDRLPQHIKAPTPFYS